MRSIGIMPGTGRQIVRAGAPAGDAARSHVLAGGIPPPGKAGPMVAAIPDRVGRP